MFLRYVPLSLITFKEKVPVTIASIWHDNMLGSLFREHYPKDEKFAESVAGAGIQEKSRELSFKNS